jgi:hypothetical protein
MAALYSAAMGVREMAKFATQKARPPAIDNISAFLQIAFAWIILFSPF